MRAERVVAQRRTHAADLIDGNRSTDASAAYHNAALGPSRQNLVTEFLGDIRKIHGIGVVGPDVLDGMPPRLKGFNNRPFQWETSVIASDHQLPLGRTCHCCVSL